MTQEEYKSNSIRNREYDSLIRSIESLENEIKKLEAANIGQNTFTCEFRLITSQSIAFQTNDRSSIFIGYENKKHNNIAANSIVKLAIEKCRLQIIEACKLQLSLFQNELDKL